jgi:hypothetical protein
MPEFFNPSLILPSDTVLSKFKTVPTGILALTGLGARGTETKL